MIFDLPVSVEVCGVEYAIRSDFRAVLDICTALEDPGLSAEDKAETALNIFYPGFDVMPVEHYREALEKCYWFIDCGGELDGNQKAPKLMNWTQDFKYIVAPINRVMGCEVRAAEPMHWWTFISAYYEIGDCLFAHIVRIRDLLARGKKLDKSDWEFYRRNRELIDLKVAYTQAEEDLLKQWT